MGSQVVAGCGVRGGTPDTETAQVVGGMCPLITRNGSPGATGAERLGGCWEASGVRSAVAGAAGVGGIGAACGEGPCACEGWRNEDPGGGGAPGVLPSSA